MALLVSGFGGERMARFSVDGTHLELIETLPVGPGTNDIALAGDDSSPIAVLANPLVDGVVRLELANGRQTARLQPTPELDTIRSFESRLGEALFYTTLLTPANRSAGELSRFTCEACHFEGGIDGRVHFSGRGRIYASTRPLFGLADNLPLFSRGGAESLAVMVEAEFRVANQQRQDTFFIRSQKHPWLKALGKPPQAIDPLLQRRAFLKFFTEFDHRPNPWRSARPVSNSRVHRGLQIFQKRCLDCHQPHSATDADKLLPLNRILLGDHPDTPEPIWAAPLFFKTGITPYVDRAGTRVPTLRRIRSKYPYFTNGSSPDLRHLLQRFRYRGSDVRHNLHAPDEAIEKSTWNRLSSSEIDALEAFLRYF